MAETIYKYELEITDRQEVRMSRTAEFLSVQMQGDKLCLWAMVRPNDAQASFEILIFGTGHTLPVPYGRYIGTVQQGQFVWHVFYKMK